MQKKKDKKNNTILQKINFLLHFYLLIFILSLS